MHTWEERKASFSCVFVVRASTESNYKYGCVPTSTEQGKVSLGWVPFQIDKNVCCSLGLFPS